MKFQNWDNSHSANIELCLLELYLKIMEFCCEELLSEFGIHRQIKPKNVDGNVPYMCIYWSWTVCL